MSPARAGPVLPAPQEEAALASVSAHLEQAALLRAPAELWARERRPVVPSRFRSCNDHVRCDKNIPGKQGCGNTGDADTHSSKTGASGCSLQSQQAQDAFGKRPTIRGHQQGRRRTPFLHQRECTCVTHRLSASGERCMVTTHFALDPNPAADPPDRRMIEKQHLGGDLQQVDESVVATDVREFMGDDGLQLLRAESGYRLGSHQHDGLKPTQHGRGLQPAALAVADASVAGPSFAAKRDTADTLHRTAALLTHAAHARAKAIRRPFARTTTSRRQTMPGRARA